ncbi:hypothetical protein [Actinomadura gamaensis]|uniref:Uncharacterized protein n=1 Tax=Actinomadura gamaensis TaxID=1763541 RepID=A0ABV9U1E1_9ACTN
MGWRRDAMGTTRMSCEALWPAPPDGDVPPPVSARPVTGRAATVAR